VDKDNAAPAEQEPDTSGAAGSGSTIPKSKDGISITSTPGRSSFEPEEDVASPENGDSGDSAEGSGKEA
jgi:hypothetical protein